MVDSNGAVDLRTAVPKGPKGYENENASIGTQWWSSLDTYEETPELRWPLNIYNYDRMRRQDAQVIQVLRAVMLPIRRTPWRIDPNGAPDEVVEHVANDLGLPIVGQSARPLTRVRNRFDWNEHLRLALLSLVFGHSFFEQVYSVTPDGPNGALRAHLQDLQWRPPRTIARIDVAADGDLVAIRQQGLVGGKTEVDIPASQLVAYITDREGGNWLGQSLLRPAYKFWLLKDRLLRVQAQTIDRNGMGFPVYTAPEVPLTVQGEDRTRLEQSYIDAGFGIASGMRAGENAGASISAGAKLALLGVEGQLPDADKPIRYYDEQIAKAVLANFLSLGGDNSTGSYALGDTFQDFFTLSLQSVALDLATTATRHVVEDIVDLNYGTDVPAPRIVFDEIGSRHPVTAGAINALVLCGAITMDDPLEEYLRTTYGLPPRDPKTARSIGPKTAPNAAPDGTAGGGTAS
ncbi:hypothetical protein [Curtobacterium sp. MCBD17_028]|uniref:phage portal protein family protein n=1 Tax=Curtobacterium sp. MCBD17_028 TaxID=2175670 RepID=UPI0015E89769|nr:hypothetical protein [Curtobacterium sp. MCBD17_028]